MSNKNNIDKLFKENLKGFEASPDASVWDSISTQLNQDVQPRKAIPIWWKIAGIAAGILILVSIGSIFINSDAETQPVPEVVDQDSGLDPVSPDNSGESDRPGNVQNQPVSPVDLDKTDRDDTIVAEGDKTSLDNESDLQNTVITDESGSDKRTLNQDSDAVKAVIQNRKDDLLKNDTTDTVQDAVAVDQNEQSDIVDDPLSNQAEQKANELLKEQGQIKDSRVAQMDETSQEEPLISTEEIPAAVDEAKDDIKEAVAAQIEEEEIIEEEEEARKNRWGVAPHVAPVYFNSFGNGSAIDEQFVNNSRSGEINMNYGIAASYDLDDKFTLRAGINQMKLGYRTNDVIVYNNIQPTIDDKPLRNVNLNAANMDLAFLSVNGLNVAQVPGVVAANIESSIDQQLGFIEIPLEMEYKITDKKLGLSVIGGMSTLILNENKVYSSLQGVRNELGEASNINSTSFSANLGMGMKYKVSKRINLNLEPVFKYQLNTFKDTSGNFKPYTIGVYTGFSFKF
ncbi:MAG: outer membrane beta-barrel protein [Flavobacteriaceae bacterium]|nr:outer membrane beta-barrel protein [Flavobacteriaceae bacterium]